MKKTLVCAMAAGSAGRAAHAQDLPKTQLKVVGGLSNLTAYNDYAKSLSGPRPFPSCPARSRPTSRASMKWI